MMKKMAFTITEIMVVVIILGVLAAIALPKIATTSHERMIAAEGMNTLKVVMDAQNRRCQETGSFGALSTLDITVPPSSFFGAPSLGGASCTTPTSSAFCVVRNTGEYQLCVAPNNAIGCSINTGGICAKIKCTKNATYTMQCN